MVAKAKSRFKPSLPLLCICLSGAICFAPAQTTAQTTTQTTRTVRKHRVAAEENSVAPAVAEAESALEKQDYNRAEKLLVSVIALDARDYRAFFDLAYVYNATERRPEAIDAYRKSLAIKPDVFAANLNLGLLLANSDKAEAAKYLRAATQLKPDSKPVENLTRAWITLGRVLAPSNPAEAISAFRKAAELNPKDPEPHLSAAGLMGKRNDLAGAESEYKAALAIDSHSTDALAGLVQVYISGNRLSEAESTLREYLQSDPKNAAAHLQLGRLLAKTGKTDGALAEYEIGLKASPQDKELTREVAALYAADKRFDNASPLYEELVTADPNDATLRHQYGLVLLHQRKFAEAQEQLLAALERDRKLVDAYGDLALAASENKNYQLTIGVLDARAKLAPETPATYFLKATAYDNLKAFTQASENYHLFLLASNGQFPDREWQARHRLIAIEPSGEKKKK